MKCMSLMHVYFPISKFMQTNLVANVENKEHFIWNKETWLYFISLWVQSSTWCYVGVEAHYLLFCHHHSTSLHHQNITNEINPIFLPMHWGQCWQLKLTNTKSTQNILTCPTKNKIQIYDDVKFPNGELIYLFDYKQTKCGGAKIVLTHFHMGYLGLHVIFFLIPFAFWSFKKHSFRLVHQSFAQLHLQGVGPWDESFSLN